MRQGDKIAVLAGVLREIVTLAENYPDSDEMYEIAQKARAALAAVPGETAISTQRITEAQAQLWALASQLANQNVDAAEELGKRLVQEAAERKRVRGLGIGIRINLVTQRLEIRTGS